MLGFKRPDKPFGQERAAHRAYAHQHPHPVKKLRNEGPEIVDGGCSNYPYKTDTVRKSTGKQKKTEVNTGKQTGRDVQYRTSATNKTRKAVEALAKKTNKKTPDKPYKEVLEFPETGEVSLWKKETYHISVSIGNNPSQMRPNICAFNTGEVPNLIGADFLDPSCLDSIQQHDILDYRIASITRLKMTGIITV